MGAWKSKARHAQQMHHRLGRRSLEQTDRQARESKDVAGRDNVDHRQKVGDEERPDGNPSGISLQDIQERVSGRSSLNKRLDRQTWTAAIPQLKKAMKTRPYHLQVESSAVSECDESTENHEMLLTSEGRLCSAA